ncbi:hypothetical protein H9Q69_012799 [Fusarium xylarioides]|nr:hypothetical protein H9Q69_012799 [Fusarium xylarioides]KAG5803977.1 hypothetical protein H9Q71_011440 [Fusarium xylarioides]KAG5815478.1 hypothetical protein H9Q74_011669 [Fusarium xylarioides]
MVEWQFEVIHNITSNRKLLGTVITPEWQMWDEAYFKRVSDTLADPTHTAKLMAEGCNNGDLRELNCTKTCDSAEYMFRSPQNLWNCMTLSTVAMKVIPEPTNDTVNRDSEKNMDDMFHFGSLRDFDRLFAFRKVRECLWQSCSDSKYGKCTEDLFDYQCSPIHQFNIGNLGTVLSERYCSVADPGFDFDLVGQGVLISYIMQYVLVLFFCLSFALTLKWFRRFCRQFPSAITSTLVDLQETQTLFAATISVATIVAFHCYTGLANVASISSYVLNNEIAHGVIIIGMSPLLLLQLVLHASEHASTYTLSFVFLNWLCIVIKSALQKGGAAGFEKTLKRQSSMAVCGDNPGAMSYCMNYNIKTGFSHIKLSLIFVHVLTFLLLMDWALATLHGSYEKKHLPNKGSWVRNLIRKKALAILTVFLAIVPMAFGLTDLVRFYKGLRDRYTPEGGLPWSFGQVTAVAVWFPVVCKFLHYCVVKDGVQARIDKDEYVVSRRETAFSELKSSEELGSDKTSFIGRVIPDSMVGAEPIEMRASLNTSVESLLMSPHAG